MGGLGALAYDSFDSNLEALVGYKVHDQIRLYAGYRGRYYTFNKGGEGIKSHGWYHGPVLGAVLVFRHQDEKNAWVNEPSAQPTNWTTYMDMEGG